MLLESIQSELVRLQLHPANLGAAAAEGCHVALRGSLLSYWKLPSKVDAARFLAVLRTLPDAAGPELVMNTLVAAQVDEG